MKNKKAKENIIGKIIYSFILFMPLLTILFTALYATFNKNAYKSYYGETINEKNYIEVNNIQTYVGEAIYDVDNTITYSFTDGTNYFDVENFKSQIPDINNNEVTKIQMYSAIYQNDYNMWISLRDNNNNILKNINVANTSTYFTCYIIDYSKQNNSTTLGNFENYFYKYEYNKLSYLDNSFDYGLYKAEQNPLFNWSKNTGLYTVLNTTCTTLGINTTFIPFIFAYWLLVSLIYILYDIALVGINIIHNKIHELEGTF